MNVDELVERVLSLPKPWVIEGAEVDDGAKRVEIRVSYGAKKVPCPTCKKACTRHDAKGRKWRHLDMWDYQTWIVCSVPRASCAEHGIHRIEVPWADGYARFTAQFECVVIDWLKEASMSATARNLGLTWDQVSGIEERAVKRGLERREKASPTRIGVDETSFQKRHEYVTIVSDLKTGVVLHVAAGRGKNSLNGFYEQLDEAQLEGIEAVAMDMHAPYIFSTANYVPKSLEKICFDRFHVAQALSRAVDQTRRSEAKRLSRAGDDSLKGTRFLWLKSRANLPWKLRRQLGEVLEASAAVATVWSMKEAFSKLWSYKTKTWAQKAWVALAEVAWRAEIPALDKAIATLMRHLFGIVNAVVKGVSNAAAESVNSRVQALKRRANGYHSRARFRDAIMFHLGGLDLYPRPGSLNAAR